MITHDLGEVKVVMSSFGTGTFYEHVGTGKIIQYDGHFYETLMRRRKVGLLTEDEFWAFLDAFKTISPRTYASQDREYWDPTQTWYGKLMRQLPLVRN